MNVREHWENVYQTKAPDQMSWFSPHLETSLGFIKKAAPDRSSSIIDVGAGEATLVDDLVALGYRNLTVLEISATAIEVTKKRLGAIASLCIDWMCADITRVGLSRDSYDVWHDRAVFHFLTSREQRAAYVKNVVSSVKTGGHVIIGAFGPNGPLKCSGLDVVRYDAGSLHQQFGPRFRLVESLTQTHSTPFDTTQQFLYCYCRVG